MNNATLGEKTAVTCSLCDVVIVWNGIGSTIKKHVSGTTHCKNLRRESIHNKRARSLAVKGVKFENQYYKPITKFFGKYTAVESTFRIFLNKDRSVIIVRFFSPQDAQSFLNLNSSWIIDGQCAELVPDIYSGSTDLQNESFPHPQHRERDFHARSGVEESYHPPPPTIGEEEWADSDKYKIHSDNSYIQDPQNQFRQMQNENELLTWSDYTRQQQSSNLSNNQRDLYPREQQGSRNHDSYRNEPNTSYNYIGSHTQNYSATDSKTPFVNEYRSVSLVDRSESSVYNSHDNVNNHSGRSDRRQQAAPTYANIGNSMELRDEGYKRTEHNSRHGDHNPQSKTGMGDGYSERSRRARNRENNGTVQHGGRRNDHSRSPVRHTAGKHSRSTEKINPPNVSSKGKKKIVPQVRGSLLKGSFSKQLFELLRGVNTNVCQPTRVRDVCNDISQTLNSEFKGTVVKPFGCMNLGVGIKGDSLEVCIYLPDDVKSQLLQKKSLCVKYLEVICDILKKKSPLFKYAVLSDDKSTVNFLHTPSNYEVKASILRDAMVLNDKLFEIYILSDKRLVSLFVFLIFWARSHAILEEYVFEEHELILLIIFYLQRLTKPILPPAHMLQVDDGGRNIDNKCLSYWHTTFVVNSKTFPKNENSSDLLTLIEGFFLFYADFTFKNIVISPFSGLTIPLQIFHKIADLPKEFKRYVYLVNNKYVYPLHTDSPICIQDPIKLNRNATVTITNNKLNMFREKCLSASGLMYKFQTKQTEVGLVSALLNLSENTVDYVHKLTSQIFTRYAGQLHDSDTQLVSKRLMNLLDHVLTNILKVKFTSEKEAHYSKRNNLMETGTVYSCSLYYNLWSSRDVYKNKIPDNTLTLEWEAALSKKILECVYNGLSCNSPMFDFVIKAIVKRIERVIQIEIIFNNVEDDYITGLTNFIAPIIEHELKRVSVV